jgi:hypothetical protein
LFVCSLFFQLSNWTFLHQYHLPLANHLLLMATRRTRMNMSALTGCIGTTSTSANYMRHSCRCNLKLQTAS